jgi:hypothetical protein
MKWFQNLEFNYWCQKKISVLIKLKKPLISQRLKK